MNPILLESHRGSLIENIHRGSLIILNSSGNSILSVGNPETRDFFARSALKPLQALTLLTSGAYDAYDLTLQHLALATSSHSGEDSHVELGQEWLSRLGLETSAFECGVHAPMDSKSNRKLIATNTPPSPLHNACSGKHLALLTTCLHLGYPLSGYTNPDHPLQKLITSELEALCQTSLQNTSTGIDGCSLPLWSMTLEAFARGMKTFLNSKNPEAELVFQAMTKHPDLVGGDKQASTLLMEASPQDLLVKFAAGGGFTAISRSKGISIALKVDDGSVKAADIIISQILKALALLQNQEAPNLKHLLNLEQTNYRKTPVGFWKLEDTLMDTLISLPL